MPERILKNIGSGLIAQAWSGLLGLVVLPILVRGLGVERYGLLALSLAVIGFAAVADLGVGRAASKYLAEDFERNETSRTQQHISSALTICSIMGIAGTLLLAATAPFLVEHILRVPRNLAQEARVVLWATSLGLLPVLWRISLDGALSGHHRIAELSVGNVLANTLKAGLSIAAVMTGRSIVGVVIANVGVSYLHALGLWLYTRRYFAGRVKIRLGWDTQIARELVRLGLLTSASSFLAGILLFYFDRFVIAVFLPLATLGYYSTAFDITSKQCYISNPIGQAFFPVFSGKSKAGAADFEKHYFQATKIQAVGLTGLAGMLIVLARPLLTYWISPEIARNSSTVMVVLTLGMLLSSYANLPYIAILVGSESPDVCPKIFGAAFAVHVLFSLVFVKVAGVLGVAVSLLLAFAVAFLLSSYWVSRKLLPHSLFFFFKNCFGAAWAVAAVVGVGWWLFVRPMLHGLGTTIAAFLSGYVFYLVGCGIFSYSGTERVAVQRLGRRVLGFRTDPPSMA
ncbi:MAG TPA: oligosaccharide flippase family protein [Candidatus Dormibacteraeota bacterium]|nr:oligosaccharide flippase family protein [Candidatus Dormibacteraeota bacterium]